MLISEKNTRVPAADIAVNNTPLLEDIERHLHQTLARVRPRAERRDLYLATAWSLRDRLSSAWAHTAERYEQEKRKRVYYLSLEFLMGRTLGNAALNLGLDREMEDALLDIGHNWEDLREVENDAGLGNGGLGRLAACYLDSMATLGIPAYGYGIRYEHGIFRQALIQGRQVELPDNWLQFDNPWEIARPERTFRVRFYGRVEAYHRPSGDLAYRWTDTQDVLALAYDTPVPGYQNGVVNTLRLWSARATEDFDLDDFLKGDYLAAVLGKMESETISKVLYPPDDTEGGKELRLKQQYFFVSATLQDVLRRHHKEHHEIRSLPEYAQIQLNDTHPAIAVAELMRILMDEEEMGWNEAWSIVINTFAYTNHTVLPEALESWSEGMFGRLLPRHMDIIREVDRRFQQEVQEKWKEKGESDDSARESALRMAIIKDGRVHMANLAIVGSHSVNGVAELHSTILKERIFRDFYQLWPERFHNVTNGVTPRRWIAKANPGLSALLTREVGSGWERDLERLSRLESRAEDPALHEEWRSVKRDAKVRLVEMVEVETGISFSPEWMVDVQIKRIHEYKRQILNILRLIDSYLRLRDDPSLEVVPRMVILGGKAAPTYWMAKQTIRLATAISEKINNDPVVSSKLRAVFIPNYRVSQAEVVIPGTDLSEQISTAGYEASGTGNMKFALNGALTIGTADGANIEIADAVGWENLFIFGLSAAQVIKRKEEGYVPWAVYQESERLKRILDFVASGALSPEEPGLFHDLTGSLIHRDPFLALADFDAYLKAQEEVDRVWTDQREWTRRAILNVARSGRFSSDRSIEDYAREIWKVPVHALHG